MDLDFAVIEKEIADGFICRQRHPTAPLNIYNYSARAQWENRWTAETKACRGLIISDAGQIIARPFPKFFNYDQVTGEIPKEPFEAFEKLDGSLGILYWIGDRRFIATRGSFTSDQAKAACELLDGVYSSAHSPKGLTLLFEIILPENRIVVDYGQRRQLVLLAAIHTESGYELPYQELFDFGFPVVERLDGITDLAAIQTVNRDNFEGFVIRFASGFRCKIKLAEYVRLHKLLTGVTPRAIWEELRSGRGIEALIDRVPDEFMRWLREAEARIRADFSAIESECARVHREDFPSRKDAAEYISRQKYPPVLFRMLDHRDASDIIWKLIYPPAATAFRCQTESTA